MFKIEYYNIITKINNYYENISNLLTKYFLFILYASKTILHGNQSISDIFFLLGSLIVTNDTITSSLDYIFLSFFL
jgi:hypothetical protein